MLLLAAACATHYMTDPVLESDGTEAGRSSLAGCAYEQRVEELQGTMHCSGVYFDADRILTEDCVWHDGTTTATRNHYDALGGLVAEERDMDSPLSGTTVIRQTLEHDDYLATTRSEATNVWAAPWGKRGESVYVSEYQYTYVDDLKVAEASQSYINGGPRPFSWTESTWAYDDAGRVIARHRRHSTTPRTRFSEVRAYDAQGFHVQTRFSTNGLPTGVSTLRYDTLGRLITEDLEYEQGHARLTIRYAYVDDSPWIAERVHDFGADGVVDLRYVWTYVCPS